MYNNKLQNMFKTIKRVAKKILAHCDQHVMGMNSNLFWLFAVLNWSTKDFWFFAMAAIAFRGLQEIIDELRKNNKR